MGRPAPHLTPSGGGHAPTPDRSESSATGSPLRRVDNRGPVTEGPVDIRGSLGGPAVIRAPLWRGLGDAGAGSGCGLRRGVGEGRTIVARQGVRPWCDGPRQPAVPGGGAVAGADRRTMARPAGRFRPLEQRLPAVPPL